MPSRRKACHPAFFLSTEFTCKVVEKPYFLLAGITLYVHCHNSTEALRSGASDVPGK
jgi:hypothetical protein